ncbi:xanthine dehydrogenase family protein molybdopterin-binding subunit [Paenibacillus sp. GCM10023250]|uniref:xanthine dehydrogenase family protein molybdopterin-binding subunit n=1 Tax=Paenibacillus sp. GCM10023250 TaxID=3252648 RepID=UPI00361FF227
MDTIGKGVPRLESRDKVTGFARYTNDTEASRLLHGWLVTSPHAHARIVAIDASDALKLGGVRAVVTGEAHPEPTGPLLADRPPLAYGKARYFGEPIAVVVADTERLAKLAAGRIRTAFEPLPAVRSPSAALLPDAPLVHDDPAAYRRYGDVYPEPNSNIGSRTRIRKGDMNAGWAASDVIVETSLRFGPSDHAAMEPRSAIVEIMPSGLVRIESSTQDGFHMGPLFEQVFGLKQTQVATRVPFVGGAFGGKGSVQLEYIAYLASKACGGLPVKINNVRETDMAGSPSHIGLEAAVKVGASRDGKLQAVDITYLFDTGGYTDLGPSVAKAAAVDCTGPYRVDNVRCDSLCVYTNHPYATAFRGFGHTESHYCIERAMDLLADRLGMDPLALRLLNAVKPGDTTPTQAPLNRSNLGDVEQCIARLKTLIRWEDGRRVEDAGGKVRAKGAACIWKTSTSKIDTGSGAVVTFNPDGSLNLGVGPSEIGQGNRTAMAQLLARRMDVPLSRVRVKMDVDTELTPEHWKTVASSSTMMAGRAVLGAADDALAQLKRNASRVLKRPPEELETAGGAVYARDDPKRRLTFGDLANGYAYPDGSTAGEPVIGRGTFRVHGLRTLDPETGKGIPGPQWTVGAQAVEVELDTRDWTYRILTAASVFDAGRVLNEALARGQVMGGMNMGLSFATREGFLFDEAGAVLNPQLRTYKITRYGETPDYLVDFVETPYLDGPYGARGIGEHSTIGMPAALANALSAAAGVPLNELPLTPELIWRHKEGGGQP